MVFQANNSTILFNYYVHSAATQYFLGNNQTCLQALKDGQPWIAGMRGTAAERLFNWDCNAEDGYEASRSLLQYDRHSIPNKIQVFRWAFKVRIESGPSQYWHHLFFYTGFYMVQEVHGWVPEWISVRIPLRYRGEAKPCRRSTKPHPRLSI